MNDAVKSSVRRTTPRPGRGSKSYQPNEIVPEIAVVVSTNAELRMPKSFIFQQCGGGRRILRKRLTTH